MVVFADSSAVVKLYADEPDHQLLRELDLLIVSALARAEVPAAIWRKNRMGDLDPADAAVLIAAFEADYHGSTLDQPRFAVVTVTASVLEAAARLAGVHGLRASDAVQLASAKATAQTVPGCGTVAAFDVTLRTAAAAEGFRDPSCAPVSGDTSYSSHRHSRVAHRASPELSDRCDSLCPGVDHRGRRRV